MADGPIILGRQEAILFKLQASPGTDAAPVPTLDAVPFNRGTYSDGEATRLIEAVEASDGLAAGAPVIAGQSVPISFTFQLKGAGAGTTYTSVIRPPHHAVYAACGLKPFFQAAVATTLATAGTTTAATLQTPYVATAQAYRGMPMNVTAGPNSGEALLCSDYTVGRVATFADLLGTAMTAASSIAVPANWTYAPTSPADAAARATDHPGATLYRYVGGKLRKFIDVRGQITINGNSSNVGTATFQGTGTFVDETDAAFPTTLAIAGHSAPLILQGNNVSEAFLINRRPLAISQFSLAMSATIETPDDPNTANGFGEAIIGGRTPLFSCDPLQSQVATRNTLADIVAGNRYTGAIRGGYTAGNRWGLTMPLMQPVSRAEADRGEARSENTQLRVLNPGKDAQGRDNDFVLNFS
ncbi:hypothetical protein [Sandarakinorhabdus sp.]|uniref:hypothetical protein n=1 Tax=Sandarakinorhabdus sp. TaxID=1916663 RepID=UPI00286E98E5|nr:hypothetical protein [Sandarakinorhabdus sp.]